MDRPGQPARAISFVDELLVRCGSLCEYSDRFPIYGEARGRIVRKMSHHSYVILYIRLADQVEVVHVVHGSRDLEALLDGSPDD
jgi:plasmid stabilization system protein ParE